MVIVFKAKNIGFYVQFNETPTANDMIKGLPVEGVVSKWGDEIYFKTGINASGDGRTTDINVGDVAYWPEGQCLCIFYGPTQASTTDKPVPASPVIIVGKTMASPDELREIHEGERISVFVFAKKEYAAAAVENPYDDNRRLSQSEIDLLVRRLLAEKEKGGVF
jgi:hypothetical protein